MANWWVNITSKMNYMQIILKILVSGALTLLYFIGYFGAYAIHDSDRKKEFTFRKVASRMLSFYRCIVIFFLAWLAKLIIGSLWVFGIWSTVTYDRDNKDYYCDKTVYMLSFVGIIIDWTALPLLMVFLCCMGCFMIVAVQPTSLGWYLDQPRCDF